MSIRVGDRISVPVVHVPEKLQVELVDSVVDLLPVALHQFCVVHQLLLQRNTPNLGQNLRAEIAVKLVDCKLTWLKRCGSTVSGRALVRPDSWETDGESVRRNLKRRTK